MNYLVIPDRIVWCSPSALDYGRDWRAVPPKVFKADQLTLYKYKGDLREGLKKHLIVADVRNFLDPPPTRQQLFFW